AAVVLLRPRHAAGRAEAVVAGPGRQLRRGAGHRVRARQGQRPGRAGAVDPRLTSPGARPAGSGACKRQERAAFGSPFLLGAPGGPSVPPPPREAPYTAPGPAASSPQGRPASHSSSLPSATPTNSGVEK